MKFVLFERVLYRKNVEKYGKTAVFPGGYCRIGKISHGRLLWIGVYRVRDWSLITGEGGATKREGGACEVLPLRKGGAEKVLAMLKGGTKSFGVDFTR